MHVLSSLNINYHVPFMIRTATTIRSLAFSQHTQHTCKQTVWHDPTNYDNDFECHSKTHTPLYRLVLCRMNSIALALIHMTNPKHFGKQFCCSLVVTFIPHISPVCNYDIFKSFDRKFLLNFQNNKCQ